MMESRSRAWEHDAPRLCFRPLFPEPQQTLYISQPRYFLMGTRATECVYQHSLSSEITTKITLGLLMPPSGSDPWPVPLHDSSSQ
jgi:hypothetical protein